MTRSPKMVESEAHVGCGDGIPTVTEKVLHMDAGQGESRYAVNSDRQLYVFRQLQHHFTAALRHLRLPENGPLRITDHGCASGPNTVAHMRFFLHNIPAAATGAGDRPVQLFFNDLPSNDFNDLSRRVEAEFADGRKTYVSSVPGSFHRQILPPASVHVAYSVMALHYLSQVPAEVTRPGSTAYNAGKLWINGGNSAAAEAYEAQARRDLSAFFLCRAREMVEGGVLMLLLMGRPDGSPPHRQIFAGGEFCGQDFEQAWDQLIAEGALKAEQKDTFNLPWYFPTAEELKSAAEETGGFETIHATVCHVASKTRADFEEYVGDAANYGRMKSRYVKSFTGSLVEAHIGKRYSEELFERFSEHSAALLAANPPARTTVCAVATFRRRGRPSDAA